MDNVVYMKLLNLKLKGSNYIYIIDELLKSKDDRSIIICYKQMLTSKIDELEITNLKGDIEKSKILENEILFLKHLKIDDFRNSIIDKFKRIINGR
jgi:hypothetical protein